MLYHIMVADQEKNNVNKNIKEEMTEWFKVADCKSVRIFLS